MVVIMNNGITLLEQLPVPTLKQVGILYQIKDSDYKVKINGAKIEDNPNLKNTIRITISFTFIGNEYIEIKPVGYADWIDIEDGDICNHMFIVDNVKGDLYIDNESDFYDILNCILQNKGLIPKGNDKAILLSKDKLNDYITDETIVLKTILEDTGHNTWVSKIILNNPLMVGGL